jgi:hypothetical protein
MPTTIRFHHLIHRRSRARLIAWCMALAFLVSFFAPTIAQVQAAQHPERLIELCSSAGIKKIALNSDGTPNKDTVHWVNHCELCCFNQHQPDTPPIPATISWGWLTAIQPTAPPHASATHFPHLTPYFSPPILAPPVQLSSL